MGQQAHNHSNRALLTAESVRELLMQEGLAKEAIQLTKSGEFPTISMGKDQVFIEGEGEQFRLYILPDGAAHEAVHSILQENETPVYHRRPSPLKFPLKGLVSFVPTDKEWRYVTVYNPNRPEESVPQMAIEDIFTSFRQIASVSKTRTEQVRITFGPKDPESREQLVGGPD